MRVFIALLLLTLAPGAALANDHFILVSAREVFVPTGFDDNDDVVVVLDSPMTAGCIAYHHTDVIYDSPSNTFFLKQFTSPTLKPCLSHLNIYTNEVSLGTLAAGSYTVRDWGGAEAALEIAEAGNAWPDDPLVYAPVESLDVNHDAETGVTTIVLAGQFDNTCTRIERVDVIDSGKTKEILPFQQPVDAPGCEEKKVPFTWFGTLPQQAPGRYLAHVRSFNGESLNLLFDIQ